jgi:hypothetical protein
LAGAIAVERTLESGTSIKGKLLWNAARAEAYPGCRQYWESMLATSNVAIQFGAKP